MGEVANLIMAIANWIKRNYKKPKLWIIILLFVFLMVCLIPYIDSNFYYYGRMEKRITILKELTELDLEKIDSNTILQEEYKDILNDIQEQDGRMVSSIITKISNAINDTFKVKPQESSMWIKFLSGAMLCLLLAFMSLFMNTFKSKKEKIICIIMLIIFGVIFGVIGANIPTIIHPNINYWGMPIVQIVLFVLIIMKFSKTDNKKEA